MATQTIAIENVTVVPLDADRVLADQTVLLRKGRIAAMGPAEEVEVPTSAQRVDGRGRFLMPGLVDMHAHLTPAEGEPLFYEDNPASLALWLTHGVTTVRNLLGTPSILALRKRVQAGELVGPEIVTSGPIVEGRPSSLRGTPWSPVELAARPLALYVGTADDARQAVRYHAHAGYDLVKVYDGVPEAAYWALVEEAEAWGLAVVGHVPRAVGLAAILTRRPSHATIEHAEAFAPLAEASRQLELDSDQATASDPFAREALRYAAASPERIALLAAWAAAREMPVTPTLLVYDRFRAAPARVRDVLASPDASLTSSRQRGAWRSRADGVPAGLARRGLPLDAARAFALALVRQLDAAGAPLLLGTDAPTSVAPQGAAVHDELALFVEAGLSPYRALRAATVTAHAVLRAHGLSDASGTLAVGEPADLLLLRANPLLDVGAVRQLDGLALRGRWLDADELAALRAHAVATYAP